MLWDTSLLQPTKRGKVCTVTINTTKHVNSEEWGQDSTHTNIDTDPEASDTLTQHASCPQAHTQWAVLCLVKA